jgi:hypothetical protein
MPHFVTGARHDRSSNQDFDGAWKSLGRRTRFSIHRPPSTPANATAPPEAPPQLHGKGTAAADLSLLGPFAG